MGRMVFDGRTGALAALAVAGTGHAPRPFARPDVQALCRAVAAVTAVTARGLPSPACAGRSPPVILT